MNNKMTFKERLIRFMSGRNGTDRFGQALLVFYLALFVLNLFLHSWIISLVIDITIVYTLFRMFSRNLYKRQKENAWYCKTLTFSITLSPLKSSPILSLSQSL